MLLCYNQSFLFSFAFHNYPISGLFEYARMDGSLVGDHHLVYFIFSRLVLSILALVGCLLSGVEG